MHFLARKTEKEELMKDLTAESSRQAAGLPTPSIPTHHTGNVPPARPPPPQVQQQAQSSGPSAPAPYPVAMAGMPQPMMGYSYMPPMPASFNPYATLPPGGIPYPTQFTFPQAPGKLLNLNTQKKCFNNFFEF